MRTLVARTVVCILMIVFSFAATAQDADSARIYEGFWVTPNFSSVVEISNCDGSLCAEIAWLWSVSIAGRQLLDEKNPNSSKQRQPLVGLQLFKQFKPDGGFWRGRIYNPEDGRTYRASVKQIDKNSLHLKGCWGPFCRSQRWRRLSSVSMPTEAQLMRRK